MFRYNVQLITNIEMKLIAMKLKKSAAVSRFVVVEIKLV